MYRLPRLVASRPWKTLKETWLWGLATYEACMLSVLIRSLRVVGNRYTFPCEPALSYLYRRIWKGSHFLSIPEVPCDVFRNSCWERVCLHLNGRYWEQGGRSVFLWHSQTCVLRLRISVWKPTKPVIQETPNAPAVANHTCPRAAELRSGRASRTQGGFCIYSVFVMTRAWNLIL